MPKVRLGDVDCPHRASRQTGPRYSHVRVPALRPSGNRNGQISVGSAGVHPLRRGEGMRLIADYVDRSIKFEHLAATEKNSAVKAQLEKQAAAYRTLAER